MENTDLKFISAYWCKSASPKCVEIFTWAWEKAEETVMDVGDEARGLLVRLAKSAPDERAASYLTAGPLENYINLVVSEKNADEAAFIISNLYLKNLLGFVWGDKDKLEPLAKSSHMLVNFQEPQPEKLLKILSIKELMGFWCRVSGSHATEEYESLYNQVLKKLLNKKSRDSAMQDITTSAPDDTLLTYVKENVFVLRDW